MSKQLVLMVGSGAISNALAKIWADSPDWSLLGVRRNTDALASNIAGLQADYTDLNSLRRALADISPDYVVLTFTPAEFNAAAYEAAYLGGVRNTLAALQKPPKRILFVSSTSVYGQSNGEWVDEFSPAEAPGFSGQTMLACEQLLLASDIPSTSFRCGGIYSDTSQRLVSAVLAGKLSGGTQFTNRIHRQDCAAAIAHLLTRDARAEEVASCYIGVDNEPCQKLELEAWLADRLGVSVPAETQDAINSSREGDGARRVSSNKRCRNAALVGSGYKFRYPSYREGYTAVLNAFKASKAPE